MAGLARYGFVDEAARVVDGLLAALGQYPDHRLPELFAGYDRDLAPFPVEYPTASRPQAWASGTVFLLLTTMLRLDAHATAREDGASPFLPSGVRRLRLDGVWVGHDRTAIEVTGAGRRVIARVLDGRRAADRANALRQSS